MSVGMLILLTIVNTVLILVHENKKYVTENIAQQNYKRNMFVRPLVYYQIKISLK